jgi:hypothetical protein
MTPRRRAVVGLLLVLLAFGCTSLRGRVLRCTAVPRCIDGLPPKALIDVTCLPDGICGYSCVPNRWKVEP